MSPQHPLHGDRLEKLRATTEGFIQLMQLAGTLTEEIIADAERGAQENGEPLDDAYAADKGVKFDTALAAAAAAAQDIEKMANAIAAAIPPALELIEDQRVRARVIFFQKFQNGDRHD